MYEELRSLHGRTELRPQGDSELAKATQCVRLLRPRDGGPLNIAALRSRRD